MRKKHRPKVIRTKRRKSRERERERERERRKKLTSNIREETWSNGVVY